MVISYEVSSFLDASENLVSGNVFLRGTRVWFFVSPVAVVLLRITCDGRCASIYEPGSRIWMESRNKLGVGWYVDKGFRRNLAGCCRSMEGGDQAECLHFFSVQTAVV